MKRASVLSLLTAVVLLGLAIRPAAGQDFVHTTGTLSQYRSDLAATSVGTKALFGGGCVATIGGTYNIVDIYDTSTGLWSVEHLSQARNALAATSVNGKALFAGGALSYYNDTFSDRVDIYDNATGTWSTAALSQARNRLGAATLNGKAYFAGGVVSYSGGYPSTLSHVVDVYDSATNGWSVLTMPDTFYDCSVVAVGGKLVIAGGSSNVVDIYNPATNKWTTAMLSQARNGMASAVVGNKALFVGGIAGGQYQQNIDIYDASTNTWSSSLLPARCGYMAGASIGDTALFGGGVYTSYSKTLRIYDASTGLWTTGPDLAVPRFDLVATAVNGTVLFGGGYGGGNTVDIYTVPEPATLSLLAVGLFAMAARRGRAASARN